MFLAVHVVGVQVQKHFGARHGRDARAHDALDLRQALDQAGPFGAAAGGGVGEGGIDGDGARGAVGWYGGRGGCAG